MLVEPSSIEGSRLPTFLTLFMSIGRKNAEVLELRRAVAGRLAEVEALAAGRLQLVDLLFVLGERRLVDLDAGLGFEIRDDRIAGIRPTTSAG